jgi:uncharacterized protein
MTAPVPGWPAMRRDANSAAFFDAAAGNELLIRRCDRCGQALAPEATACTTCAGTGLSWVPACGAATLVTWTVVHHAPHTGYTGPLPYTVGIVELDEGPWLYAPITGPPCAGMALHAQFEHPDNSESYPTFIGQDTG